MMNLGSGIPVMRKIESAQVEFGYTATMNGPPWKIALLLMFGSSINTAT